MWISQGYLSFPPLASLHYHWEHVTGENVPVPVTAGTIFSFSAFFSSLVKPRSELMCPHHRGGRDYGLHAPLLSRAPAHAHFLCRGDLLPSVRSRWTGALAGQYSPSSTNLALPGRCHAEHLGANKNTAQGDASCQSLKKLLRGKIIMTARSKKKKEMIKLIGFIFFFLGCHTDASQP